VEAVRGLRKVDEGEKRRWIVREKRKRADGRVDDSEKAVGRARKAEEREKVWKGT
jgi:hypothetical protein